MLGSNSVLLKHLQYIGSGQLYNEYENMSFLQSAECKMKNLKDKPPAMYFDFIKRIQESYKGKYHIR